MTGRSRASLLLIEKLIVIAVFALCAAACASIFVESYITSNEAKDLNYALIAAKNGAERFKAYEDPQEVAKSLGGDHWFFTEDDAIIVFYNKDWHRTFEHLAVYVMTLSLIEGEPPYIRKLSVEKITGEEILSFTVAARGS